MLKKIIGWILSIFCKKPQPPITDNSGKPLPIDVKIIEIDGKKYKVTYYNDGTSIKEEIK